MSESDRKSKMISVRLADEEYKALKSRYGKYGARNVSELARLALQRILDATSQEDQILLELRALAVRVQVLESQMTEILERRQMPGAAV